MGKISGFLREIRERWLRLFWFYAKSDDLMVAVETSVLDVLEDVVQTDEVRKNPDLPLFESGLLDSIGVVQMLGALQQKCGVEIPLTDFDASTWDTPAHIVENVRSRLSA